MNCIGLAFRLPETAVIARKQRLTWRRGPRGLRISRYRRSTQLADDGYRNGGGNSNDGQEVWITLCVLSVIEKTRPFGD